MTQHPVEQFIQYSREEKKEEEERTMISATSILLTSSIVISILLPICSIEGFSTMTSSSSSSSSRRKSMSASLSPFRISSQQIIDSATSVAVPVPACYDRKVLASTVMNEFDLATKELDYLKRKGKKKGATSKSKSKKNYDDEEPDEYVPKRRIKANVRETGHDSMKYYIKSMCNHELLNKNEEIILAREIQILLRWEEEREKLEEQLLR